MKRCKRLFSMLLAVITVFSFAACGKKPVDKEDGVQETPSVRTPAADKSADTPISDSPDEGFEPDNFVLVNNVDEVLDRPHEIQRGTKATVAGYYTALRHPWFIPCEGWMLTNVYEGLVYCYMGRSDDVRPLIAQSWDVSEDYLTWTFQIREGVRFTDGTQCDAAAVDAAWDCFYSMYPSYFTNLNVVNWEATGEYELTLQLSSPCARLESELAKLYVLSPEALAQYGLEDNRSAVGTAPYYVSEAPTEPLTDYRNLEYVFKANEDYYLYERMPVIETIVVKCVLENKTMEDMLFSGELDAYTFSYRYNEAFYERLCSEFDGTVLKSCPSGSPIFFKAHLVPELQIFEVRKAINRFIDLEALNNEIYGGFGLVQSSVWSVGSSGEVPWPEGFYYSPEEGHELMAAAGLDTVGFTFKTTTTASGAELEIIKRQLAEGGINMELYVHPVESSFSYLPDEEIVSVGSPGYSNATPYDPWNFILLPDSLLRLVRSDVYDPELYAAMCDTYDEMLSSFTWDEMLEKSKTLTDMLQKDYGALPGVQAPSFAAFSKRLKGIVYISEQHVLLWNYLYL